MEDDILKEMMTYAQKMIHSGRITEFVMVGVQEKGGFVVSSVLDKEVLVNVLLNAAHTTANKAPTRHVEAIVDIDKDKKPGDLDMVVIIPVDQEPN